MRFKLEFADKTWHVNNLIYNILWVYNKYSDLKWVYCFKSQSKIPIYSSLLPVYELSRALFLPGVIRPWMYPIKKKNSCCIVRINCLQLCNWVFKGQTISIFQIMPMVKTLNECKRYDSYSSIAKLVKEWCLGSWLIIKICELSPNHK